MVHRFRQIVASVLLVAFALNIAGGQALHEWLFHSHHAHICDAGHAHCGDHVHSAPLRFIGDNESSEQEADSDAGYDADHADHGDDCPFHRRANERRAAERRAAHSHAVHDRATHDCGNRLAACCPSDDAIELLPGESAMGASRGAHVHEHHDCLICLQFSQGQILSVPVAGLDLPAAQPSPVLEKTLSIGQAIRLAYLSRGPPAACAA